MYISPKIRFIGTQYYRPPNPALEDWDHDLALIRSHGLKLIRTWLYWSHVNPKPDLWDYSDYDHLLELATKNDLRLLIQLVPESAPQWWISRYPDAMLRNADGTPYIPQALGMVSVGGYPGLSADVPEVRAAMEDFLKRTVIHYRNGPNVYGYDVWNEIMPYYNFNTHLYHPATQAKFREWLKYKYGNIEKLNEAWGGWRFTSFEEVAMSPSGNYMSQLDVHDFHRYWLREFMKWRVSIVKQADAQTRALSHAAGDLSQITKAPHDCWDMGGVVDIWGTSDYEDDFHRSALLFNSIRDSCQGKPWWLSEQTGGRVWTLFGHATRSPEFVEQKMIQAFSYGAQVNLVWQWRPESFGQESPNFGLVDEDGTPNPNTAIVGRLAKALDRCAELFSDLRFDPPDVGLVIDWRLRSWEYSAFNDSSKFGEPELLGWHRALIDVGANVQVLHLEKISNDEALSSNIKLLIFPLVIQDVPGVQETLTRFVDLGGHAIAGPYFLSYQSNGYVSPQVPPQAMQTLFRSKRKSIQYIKEPSLTFISTMTGGCVLPVKGHHVLETYSPQDSKVLAHTAGEVTATANEYGKGFAYRIGTFLGTSYDMNSNNGLAQLLHPLMRKAGCTFFPAATQGVTIRSAHSGSDLVLFVFNPYNCEVKTRIQLPQGVKKARNIITDEDVPLRNTENIMLNLAARQACVIRILRVQS